MAPGRLSTVVLDAHDAHEPAGFCVRLARLRDTARGAPLRAHRPSPGSGGTALSFEPEPEYVPPVWPTRNPGDERMMLHLDSEVDDLEAETERAVA
ncbi:MULTISPECIES: VOC family protein [Streptomyces]|uniref:VOC family protein n=1 Tax=Streptomyces TaxID=1883 RepID=UPI00211B6CF4|nr:MULTISPECIES: VOC family protein [Streptomyces]MDX3584531.1 VOC family protein [Streptomyces europaeiscabiei]WUD33683.1 VOC family protein [Streptomyces europaeiscabiei]